MCTGTSWLSRNEAPQTPWGRRCGAHERLMATNVGYTGRSREELLIPQRADLHLSLLAGQGSNLQPLDPKSSVLPVELPARAVARPSVGQRVSAPAPPPRYPDAGHGIADQEAPQAH